MWTANLFFPGIHGSHWKNGTGDQPQLSLLLVYSTKLLNMVNITN